MSGPVLIPRSEATRRDDQLPGTWRVIGHGEGLWTISIRCPLCRRHATLHKGPGFPERGHDIAPDGTVSPSVECPYKTGPDACTWHVHVRLEGWQPGELAG